MHTSSFLRVAGDPGVRTLNPTRADVTVPAGCGAPTDGRPGVPVAPVGA